MKKIQVFLFLIILLPITTLADSEIANYIKIDGNSRVSDTEIIEYSGYVTGKTYTSKEIAESIKNLFSTNLFKDIQIKLEGETLFINVIERAIISKIIIEGNELVETDQILDSLKAVGISQSKPYSKNLIDKVKQELVRLYYDNGRYSSLVKIDELELDNNLMELSLTIEEGDASKIKEVKIIGNKNFSNRQINSLIKSGPKYWFEVWSDKDVYNSTTLDQDIESIQNFYLDRGYAKFDLISKQVNLSDDKKDIFITISFNEGELYKFGTISLYGLEDFNQEIFQSILSTNIQPGGSFSRANLETSKNSIEYVLGEKGYAFPEINYNASFKENTDYIDITFTVNPKKISYVRRINIKGNTKTNDEVYRRELRQYESSLYSQNKVDRSKLRVQRLKFVNDVEVKKNIIDAEKGIIDLEFNLEETQSGEFKLGAGYSDSSGAIFNINVQQDNFLGKGNNVALQLEKSSYRKLLKYSNSNPYYTKDGITKTTSIVFSETDVSSTSTASYLSDTFAYGISYDIPISETKSYGYGAEIKLTDYTTTTSSPANVTTFLDKHGFTHFGVQLNASLIEDTRDRTVYANMGYRQALIGSMYLPPDFDYSYISMTYRGEYNTPYNLNFLDMFDWSTTFRVKPQLGIGVGIIGSSELPFHDKYFAGGNSTVRGFDSNSLGPLRNNTTCTAKTCDAIGGDFLAVIQNDWVFPPPPFLGEDKRAFRASLFVDFGNVFEDISDFSYSELRGSYGIQANFRTPVGAVSLGFVDTFKSKTGDDTKPLIFSLGGAF